MSEPLDIRASDEQLERLRRRLAESTLPEPPLVRSPVAVRVQRRERDYPRSLAERSYRDLRSFSVLERGGHFPALETPGEVAAAVLELEVQVSPG